MKPTNFFPLISIFTLFVFLNYNSDTFVAAEEVEGEGVIFSYVGKTGPAFWDKLKGSSKICTEGKRQSPINFDTTKDASAKAPKSDFKDAVNVKIFNNGNTVEVSSGDEKTPLPANVIDDGTEYELEQFHFHTPSEHRVDDRFFDVEQHLVFKKKSGKNKNEILVVAVLYNIGKEGNSFLDPIIANLPEKVDETKSIKKVELKKLLSDINNIKAAFNYDGSLTTPPCTESVEWYVNKNPLGISADQFSALRNITGFNARFTQLRSEDFEKKKRSYRRSFSTSFNY
jgi:carbonic anhydrase